MSETWPAYSAVFEPGSLVSLPAHLPDGDISGEWAWGGSTGKGVRVGVIDSGIEATHPAIEGRLEGYVAIQEGSDGLVYDTAPHQDAYGHGTACAGIIRSVAPDCELYSIKVLGERTGRGTIFAAGIRWALDHDMDVCNLSLGTTKRDLLPLLHELADLAYFRNMALVAAANNMPVPSLPSVFASVISVACHQGKDPYVFYANPHPPVEFGARGIDVEVAWRDGGRMTTSGNSYAAAHITGIAARIRAKHPGLPVAHLKTVLWTLAANTARPADRPDVAPSLQRVTPGI